MHLQGKQNHKDLAKVRIRGKNILDQAQIADYAHHRTANVPMGAKYSAHNSYNSQSQDHISGAKIEIGRKSPLNVELTTPNKWNATSDGRISTNRKGQKNSDRVYVKVPITEVIIKTTNLPNTSKKPSKSRKNTDLGHIGTGGSTMKLTQKITTHESEEPLIAKNKDLLSE